VPCLPCSCVSQESCCVSVQSIHPQERGPRASWARERRGQAAGRPPGASGEGQRGAVPTLALGARGADTNDQRGIQWGVPSCLLTDGDTSHLTAEHDFQPHSKGRTKNVPNQTNSYEPSHRRSMRHNPLIFGPAGFGAVFQAGTDRGERTEGKRELEGEREGHGSRCAENSAASGTRCGLGWLVPS
jgi:hypothetical protein